MTVIELIVQLQKMPPMALIVLSEPLEDDGEYQDIAVYERDDEVIIEFS